MATRLPLGMRTKVEVEMAALRPGREGLAMNIFSSVSAHSAHGADLCCESAGAVFSRTTQLLDEAARFKPSLGGMVWYGMVEVCEGN